MVKKEFGQIYPWFTSQANVYWSSRHSLPNDMYYAWFWHRSTIPTSHKPCCQLCIIQAALQSSQPSILHQFLCFTSQYFIESALNFLFLLCSSTSLLTLLSFMSFNKKYHIFYIKKLEGKENDNCNQHPSNSSCKR